MNFRALQIGFLICLCWGANAYSQSSIPELEIESRDPALKIEAEKYFRERIQGEVTPAKISKTIRGFYSGRSVYALQVYREGNTFQIVIEPKPVVSGIDIQGNKNIDAAELLSRLSLTTGDAFPPEKEKQIEDQLEQYYAVRGYLHANVSVKSASAETSLRRQVQISVEERDACRIHEIDLRVADPTISLAETREVLGVEKGDRCDSQVIMKKVGGLGDMLRERHYLSAKIEDPRISYTEDGLFGKLEVLVRPGPKIFISFRGNTFFFERDVVLEKAASVPDEHQFNKSWMENTAIEGIQEFYRLLGYPKAKIQFQEKQASPEGSRFIRFAVTRGPKIRIRALHFTGNSVFSTSDIESAFWGSATESVHAGAFVADDIDSSIQGVLALYQSNGFLKAKVSEPKLQWTQDQNYVDLNFQIQEGEQSTLKDYAFSGNSVFSASALSEEMKIAPGDPINPSVLATAADRLADRYREKGYKYVSVRIPRVDELASGAIAYPVQIDEGPRVYFGDVLIRGNAHTHDYVIQRELKFQTGQAYSPEKIRESRRRLLQLGFFQQISLEEINYDPETQREDILIRLDERKKRSIRFRPGYSTEDGIRGAVDLSYINIAGTGRTASISGQVSRHLPDASITQNHVVVSYREPQILNFASGRINFIEERKEEQQFNIDRQSFILGLDREWLRWLRTSLQWELEFRNPFDVQLDPSQLSPFDEQRARFGSISPIVDVDFRNDLLNPTSGSFHRLRLDYYDGHLLSEADFMQFYIRNTFYVPIYKRIRIVSALRAGFSATMARTKSNGIAEIPIEKRFRLGGSSSLRGFSRNCVGGLPSNVPEDCSSQALEQAPGGNSVFNYMVDFMLPLFGGVDLALFTDGGNAFLSNHDFSFTNIRTSAGVGLRYNTFFGPLRLDVGFKLDKRTDESLTEIHFSVGQF